MGSSPQRAASSRSPTSTTHYVARGEMAFDVLPGWWTDAGTHASKLKASILVALTKGVTFHA